MTGIDHTAFARRALHRWLAALATALLLATSVQAQTGAAALKARTAAHRAPASQVPADAAAEVNEAERVGLPLDVLHLGIEAGAIGVVLRPLGRRERGDLLGGQVAVQAHERPRWHTGSFGPGCSVVASAASALPLGPSASAAAP